jgi:hypothetical protein
VVGCLSMTRACIFLCTAAGDWDSVDDPKGPKLEKTLHMWGSIRTLC